MSFKDVKKNLRGGSLTSRLLTGMDAGLLTTSISSSKCTMVMGSAVTGTSCLQRKPKARLIEHSTHVLERVFC